MAATSLASAQTSISLSHKPKTLDSKPQPTSFLTPSTFSYSPSLKSLIARVPTVNNASSNARSSISATMVSTVAPTISLDFDTSVFKKEKISLAGHDEVLLRLLAFYDFVLVIAYLLFFFFGVVYCQRRQRFVLFVAWCVQGYQANWSHRLGLSGLLLLFFFIV